MYKSRVIVWATSSQPYAVHMANLKLWAQLFAPTNSICWLYYITKWRVDRCGFWSPTFWIFLLWLKPHCSFFLCRPNVELVLPASFPNKNYTLDLIEGKGDKKSGNCIYYLCITQLVCVPWLMKIVSCILLYSLLNSKVSLNWNLSPLFELMDITDIVLTLFSQSVLLKLQTKFSR